MDLRNLVWSKRAVEKFNRQMFWYKVNGLNTAAHSFMQNIQETVQTIQRMPAIGKIEKQTSRKIYASFPSHRLCRVYYWYDETTVFIANLRFTKTEES